MTSHYHCTAQSAAGSLAMAISSAMALEVRLALENLDNEFGMEIMPSGRLWKANDFGDWWLMQLIFIQFMKLTSVCVGSRFIALYIKSNTFWWLCFERRKPESSNRCAANMIVWQRSSFETLLIFVGVQVVERATQRNEHPTFLLSCSAIQDGQNSRCFIWKTAWTPIASDQNEIWPWYSLFFWNWIIQLVTFRSFLFYSSNVGSWWWFLLFSCWLYSVQHTICFTGCMMHFGHDIAPHQKKLRALCGCSRVFGFGCSISFRWNQKS